MVPDLPGEPPQGNEIEEDAADAQRRHAEEKARRLEIEMKKRSQVAVLQFLVFNVALWKLAVNHDFVCACADFATGTSTPHCL